MNKEEELLFSNRIDGEQYENVISDVLAEVGDGLKTKIGQKIRLYKFRQVSGYTIFTKNGEIPKYQNINQVEQFANFKTGKEPITIVWEGSSNLTNTIEKPNVNKYSFKVGSYEECLVQGDYENSLETTEKEVFGANFVVDLKSANIELTSYTWKPTIEDQINYFYIIVDERYPSFQILQLKEYSTSYNETTREFQESTLSFENINLKYSSTGRQVLDFVQFGSIGFGYAFPKEIIKDDGNVEIILDEEKLTNYGVNSIQLDTNTTSAPISLRVYGSPINNNENVYGQTQILFLLDSLLPEESNLFYNDQQMNYYFVENAKPKYKAYVESFTKNPNNALTNLGSYNVGSEKKVLGGLFVDKSKVLASNPINSTTGKYSNSINSNDAWITLNEKYLVGNYNNYMQDLISSTTMKTTDFLNFNSFVNFYTDQFTFEIEEIIKYKLTEVVGFLGGLLNLIVGGIDIGWTSNKTLKLAQPLNFLIPTHSYEVGTAIFPNAGEQPIPLEMFSDNKEQSIYPIDNKQLCSFHFSLTDYIKDTSQVISGAPIGKGGDGIWNTKYLGQSSDENLRPLFNDGRIFKYNPSTTKAIPNPIDKNVKYVIDAIDTKNVYSGDIRITAFTKDIDIFTNEFYNRSIYSSILSTTSKISGKFRILSTFINFNYWNEFNTIGSVPNTWPQALPNPKPNPINEFIWIKSIPYGSNLLNNKTFSAGTPIMNTTSRTNESIVLKSLDLFSSNLMIGAPQNKISIKFAGNTTTFPRVIYENNSDVYNSLYNGNWLKCGQKNQLQSFYTFDISQYDDATLSQFNRIAINFINELGNSVWAKIDNVDFVALKAPQIYRKSSSISPTSVFNTTIESNQAIEVSTSNNWEKLATIDFERNGQSTKSQYLATYGKEYSNLSLIIQNDDNQPQISFGSGVYERVKIAVHSTLPSRADFDGYRDIFINKNNSKRLLVNDYSKLKILRVVIFNKNYDESNDITYIN